MQANYQMFWMLRIAHISRMSQRDRLPSGLKRRSDFTDPERPGSYHYSLPQPSHTPQSSEASTSPHSSQEGKTPKADEQLPSLTARTEKSYDIVGPQTSASFHASSSKIRLPAPPPTSSATFTFPPIALSSPRPASYTPHSGTLPHKFGTDHLTIQILQRENADLASAYAQAQIYIADLETKIQASRVENGKLAKERQIMTGKIDLLEAQLEEVEQSVEQTQEHTAARDAQYSHIVELSTRLQSQGTSEQHEWSSEKKTMQIVIDSLKNEVMGLRKAYASYAKSTNPSPSPVNDYPRGTESHPDPSAEPSSYGPITETEALRRANARMEDALTGVRGENDQLAKYLEKLGGVERNIQMHLQRMETARGT